MTEPRYNLKPLKPVFLQRIFYFRKVTKVMSQHPSLRVDSVGSKHRNVLTRLERIKRMQEDNKWNERVSVLGLPKFKSMKVKVKKTKGPEEGADKAAAAPAAAGKAAAPAAAAKPAGKEAAKPAAKK